MSGEKKQKKKKEKKHEYHFVIAESMLVELKDLDMYKETKNLSTVIEDILSLLTPAVEEEQEWGHQRNSKYRYISTNPDEPRIHVAVYLPEKIYRQMKQVHHDLNFYSIAQITRDFLELFLSFVKEYGDEKSALLYLKKEFDIWKANDKLSSISIYEFVPHILRIISRLPNLKGMITIYDENFIPFYFYRL
jgi:hypothetical protein